MSEREFRKGDVVDIMFRRAIVREVHERGTLEIVHSDQEMPWFKPEAADVEVTVVGFDRAYGEAVNEW